MDTENVRIWVSQSNVCRCCLLANGTVDLQASYVKDDGHKEVYYETLKNCFGIDMVMLDWSPSRSICADCADCLLRANTFKLQVLEAEQNFAQLCNMRESTKVVIRKSHLKKKKVKNKKINKNTIDWDSDTPLNEFTRVKEIADQLFTEEREELTKVKETEDKLLIEGIALTRVKEMGDELDGELFTEERESDQMELRNDFTSKGPNHTETKIVSERKKIGLTCETILNNTTACPFRHHKSWFQCFYCRLDFMEIDKLKIHLLDKHKNVKEELKMMKRYPRSLQIEITNLFCIICNINLINIDNLCTHFERIHNRVVYKECIADYKVNSSPYVCHLCDKEFHVFRTLTMHLNVHYANSICDVCGKSFLNTKRLKVHKRTHENGHFPCLECGKVLKTKISKANHIETVHSKRIIKCQICLKPMKHYNDRIKHMSEEHDITYKFKCPICAREYKIKHYLATHMRQTHGHKNKKCKECGMAFITNHGLKKHMQKHSGVKEFTCDICNKSYARSYTLKEHLRFHNDKRF